MVTERVYVLSSSNGITHCCLFLKPSNSGLHITLWEPATVNICKFGDNFVGFLEGCLSLTGSLPVGLIWC